MTENTKIYSGIALATILLIIGGTYYLSSRDKNPELAQSPDKEVPGTVLSEDAFRINAKHSFKNGKHIVAGEVEVPTPCHSLSVDTIFRESNPEQVTLVFSAKSDADVCAQVISSRRFKIEFNAEQNASIKATFNGKEAVLNLIEAGQNENLEDFDIYLKG